MFCGCGQPLRRMAEVDSFGHLWALQLVGNVASETRHALLCCIGTWAPTATGAWRVVSESCKWQAEWHLHCKNRIGLGGECTCPTSNPSLLIPCWHSQSEIDTLCGLCAWQGFGSCSGSIV